LATGSNYSISGNTVTPNVNYNGTLSVPVTVSDGTNSSAPFNLQIQVNPVNDAPQITGQVSISIAEVQQVALDLTQLTVFDPDNVYPDDFSLAILSGANYSITGNTVIPVANFSGTLLVRVFVNDGIVNSAIYNLQILVNSTNDPPVITGQQTLTTNEGQPITIDFDDLVVTDPDNPYPTGFTLTILPGTNYTVAGNTITPNPNFDGQLSVGVKVNDGAVDSAPFNLQITVTGINNAPTITGQYNITTQEDIQVTLRLADLQVSDPDNSFPTGFTMTISPGENYSVVNNDIKPAANFNGTLSVPVIVNDGQANSPSYNVQIQVISVNDAPVITAQVALSTVEDQPITLLLENFSVTDVDNVFPTGFSLVLQGSGANYTVSGATVTPALNFSGTLGVGLLVNDGVANSELYNAVVTVANINDAPTLDIVSDVTIQEDPVEPIIIPLSGISPGLGESDQTVTVSAVTDQPGYFETFSIAYTSGPTGSLTLKPKTDQFGTAQITLRVQDNGAGEPSPNINFNEQSFSIVIEPVNDPPSITSQPITLVEAGTEYLYLIEAIDVEEETITFAAPTIPAWLSLTQNANGKATLSGTPPIGTTGEIPIVVQAKDPAADAITDQEFTIKVNSRPVITPFAIQSEEDAFYDFGADFSNNYSDADGNAMEAIKITQLPAKGTLTLSGNTVAAGDVISASAIINLKYVPLHDSVGTDVIKWVATDGTYYSLGESTITVIILPVNDAPQIIAIELPENDTLKYELGSEIPIKLTRLFDAKDADGDNLIAAEIGFSDPFAYRSGNDQFVFSDTLGIHGNFNETLGILTLMGKASVKDYVAAVRSIRFNYVNPIEPEDFDLENRRVYIKLSDGEWSETKERLVGLIYSFLDLDIANAFTPNGDNPYWNIYSPNGLGLYKDALIRVYNKRGTLVYEARGFNIPWNGNGPDGSILPPDSYYYTIDLNYDKKKYKGVVTILR
jgi:gliding motility-associated-like protein